MPRLKLNPCKAGVTMEMKRWRWILLMSAILCLAGCSVTKLTKDSHVEGFTGRLD